MIIFLLSLFVFTAKDYGESHRFTGVLYEENLCYARKKDISDLIVQIQNDPTRKVFLIGDSTVWGYGLEDDETLSKKLQKQADEFNVYNLGACGAKPLDYLLLSSLVLQYSQTAAEDEFFVFLHPKWFGKRYNNPEQKDHFLTQENIKHFFPEAQINVINKLVEKVGLEETVTIEKDTLHDHISLFFDTKVPLISDREIFFYQVLASKTPSDFFASFFQYVTPALAEEEEEVAAKNVNFEYAQKNWKEKDFSDYQCALDFSSEKWTDFENYNLEFAQQLDGFYNRYDISVKYFLPPINTELTKDCLRTNTFAYNRSLLKRTFDTQDFLETISSDEFLDENHLSPEGTDLFAKSIMANITGNQDTLYLIYDTANPDPYAFHYSLQELLSTYEKQISISILSTARELPPLKEGDFVVHVLFSEDTSYIEGNDVPNNQEYVFFYPTPSDEKTHQNSDEHIYTFKNMLPASRFIGEKPDEVGKKIIASAVMRRLFPNLYWQHRFQEGKLTTMDLYMTEKEELQEKLQILAADPRKKVVLLGDSILHMMDIFHYEYLSTFLEANMPNVLGEEYSIYNLSFSGAKHLDRLVLLTYLEDVLSEDDIVVVNINFPWLFFEPQYSHELRNAYALQDPKIFSEFGLSEELTTELEEFSEKYVDYDDTQDFVPEVPQNNGAGEGGQQMAQEDNCRLGGYIPRELQPEGDAIRVLKALSRELRKYDSYVFFSARNSEAISNCMTPEYYHNNALINQIFSDMGKRYVNLMSTLPSDLFLDATHFNREGTEYMAEFFLKFFAEENVLPKEEQGTIEPIVRVPQSNTEFVDTILYSTGEGYGKNSVYLAYEMKDDRITLFLHTGNNPKDIVLQDTSLLVQVTSAEDQKEILLKKTFEEAISANKKLFMGEVLGTSFLVKETMVNKEKMELGVEIGE